MRKSPSANQLDSIKELQFLHGQTSIGNMDSPIQLETINDAADKEIGDSV